MCTDRSSSTRLIELILLVGLCCGLMSTTGGAQEKECCDPRKQYYLSTDNVMGGEVGRVCRPGFHMASLWEIFDTSNLRYSQDLGLRILDQGAGPPAGIWGWVRTGWTTTAGSTEGSDKPGQAHCFLWSNSTDDYDGTRVRLSNEWGKAYRSSKIAPWEADAERCNSRQHVWCVED
jgi:hypothetical protein